MENILERKRRLRENEFKRQVKRWREEEQMQRIFQEMTSVIPPSIELERFYQCCKRENMRLLLQKQNWLHQLKHELSDFNWVVNLENDRHSFE